MSSVARKTRNKWTLWHGKCQIDKECPEGGYFDISSYVLDRHFKAVFTHSLDPKTRWSCNSIKSDGCRRWAAIAGVAKQSPKLMLRDGIALDDLTYRVHHSLKYRVSGSESVCVYMAKNPFRRRVRYEVCWQQDIIA